MGTTASTTTSASAQAETAHQTDDTNSRRNFSPPNNGNNLGDSDRIATLLNYAQNHYRENPTEALSALMQAMTLNGNDTDAAMQRLRTELGEDMANHVGLSASNHADREQRAFQVVQELLQDKSTLLYQRGKQDILRQTMEDGSSVVCTRCQAVVASTRWQQHYDYWCPAATTTTAAATTMPGGRSSDSDDDDDDGFDKPVRDGFRHDGKCDDEVMHDS